MFAAGSASVPVKAKLLIYNPSGSQEVGSQCDTVPGVVVQLIVTSKPVSEKL